MVGIIIVCFFVLYFFIYFAYKVSERFCSELWIFGWMKEKELKNFLEIAPWAILIVILGLAITGEDALKVSKDYAWKESQAKSSAEKRLTEADLKIMALEDEKHFASQSQVPVVKTEAQKSPEDKKEESQNEIVSAVEKMKQTENVSNSVKTEAKDETDLAKLKAQIDALNLSIAAAKAQVSAPIAPVSADAETSKGTKTTEVVATMN